MHARISGILRVRVYRNAPNGIVGYYVYHYGPAFRGFPVTSSVRVGATCTL